MPEHNRAYPDRAYDPARSNFTAPPASAPPHPEQGRLPLQSPPAGGPYAKR